MGSRPLLGNGGVHSNGSFSRITRTYHEHTIPYQFHVYLTHSLWDITNFIFTPRHFGRRGYVVASVCPSVCLSLRSSAPLIQWRFRWNLVGRFIPWPSCVQMRTVAMDTTVALLSKKTLSKISSRILWKLSEKIDFEWTLVENNKKTKFVISQRLSQIYMKLVW